MFGKKDVERKLRQVAARVLTEMYAEGALARAACDVMEQLDWKDLVRKTYIGSIGMPGTAEENVRHFEKLWVDWAKHLIRPILRQMEEAMLKALSDPGYRARVFWELTMELSQADARRKVPKKKLVRLINRELRKRGEKVTAPMTKEERGRIGDYCRYRVKGWTLTLTQDHVDLEELGRELGVLQPGEDLFTG